MPVFLYYQFFSPIPDSSFITPDSTAGTDSVAESASSTELTTKIPDDSDTGYPPDVTSEPPPAMPHPPTRVSIILIIAIVIGCIVATLFTATVAMWTYLCFRARAIHQRKSTKMGVNVVTAERNSEQIYETIPEDINGPTVPPNYTLWVQRSRDKQQGQWVFTPTNIGNNNTEVSEFVQNPAYRSLNNLPRTCQLQTAINMDENPSYCSSQERLFSN